MSKKKDERIYVRVNESTKKCLSQIANEKNTNLGELIFKALEFYLRYFLSENAITPKVYINAMLDGYYKDIDEFYNDIEKYYSK